MTGGPRTDDPRFRLRRATAADAGALFAITQEPPVFRYMFDGAAPTRASVEEWIAARLAEPRAGPGLRVLEAADGGIGGWCAVIPEADGARAELGYALHPRLWGRGLAARMAATMLSAAFAAGIREVWAGTDAPNLASRRVMERAGMRFWREALYPLGPGVEFRRDAEDPAPDPAPGPLPLV